MHVVSANITVDGGGNTVDLLKDDVLFSVAENNVTFTGLDSVAVAATKKDVIRFRPSDETFELVLDNVVNPAIGGISLVEQATTVGDTLLAQGSFLLNPVNSNDIHYLVPTGAGQGIAVGTPVLLIDGGDIGMGGGSIYIGGIDLVEDDISPGNETLTAGQVLVTLDGDDAAVGSNNLSVLENDVFYLDVTTTTLGSGTSAATATLLVEGADINLDTTNEIVTAFSLDAEFGIQSIDPAISLLGGALNYTESDPPTVIDGTASLTDPDSADYENGQLSVDLIVGGTVDDRLAIRHQGTGIGQIGVSGNTVSYEGTNIGTFTGGGDGSSPLVVTFNANANANVPAVQAVMQNTTYENVSGNPSVVPRTVRFVITDGDGGTSNVATETINVTPTNTAPTLTSFAAVIDNVNEEAEVQLTFAELNAQGDEADVDGTVDAYVVQAVTTGTLKIGTSAGTATAFAAGSNDTIDASNHAYWTPATNDTGAAINAFTVVAKDNLGALSVGAVQTQVQVNGVNDPPTVDLDTGTGGVHYAFTFTEGDGLTTIVDASVAVANVDDTSLVNVTFDTGGVIDGASEQLRIGDLTFALDAADFTNATVDIGGSTYTVNWVYATSVATVTLNSGEMSIAQSEAVMLATQYQHTDTNNPTAGALTIDIRVNDGDTDSTVATSTITVAAVNDAPTADLDTGTGGVDYAFTFIEGDGLTTIVDASVTVADVDDTTLANVTFDTGGVVDGASEQLKIGDLTYALDAADFTNATVNIGGSLYTVNWVNATGIATATLNSGVMSIAQSEAVMLATQYQHTDTGNPTAGNRTIDIRVNDGNIDSAVATSTITVAAVNDAPTADLDTGTGGVDYAFTFTEGDGLTTIVDASVTVADVDDTSLANVTLDTGGVVDGASERLAIGSLNFALDAADFTDTAVNISGTLYTVNWVNATGIATVTLNSGVMSIAQSEAVMLATQYQHTDTGNPTAGDRTIDIRVNDGNTDSAVATSTITVAVTNDAPGVNVPVTQLTNEDTRMVFSVGNNQVRVTLDVTNGIVTLNKFVGPESQVNIETTDDQKRPVMAMDDAGNYVVVWESTGQDGDLGGIYAQRYDATGAKLGGEFKVNTTFIGDQKNPAVSMDADGSKYKSEFQVNTSTGGDQKHATVAIAGGDFVIAWEGPDADKKGVFAQRFDFNSTIPHQNIEFQVNSSNIGDQKEAAVALNASGEVVVAWEGLDANQKGVFAQRIDFNDTSALPKAGNEFQVNSSTAGDQKRPAVAMDADGDFVVAWESPDGNMSGIFAQRFDYKDFISPIPTQGLEFSVNSTTAGEQKRASVAMDNDGDFIVAWQGPDANQNGVFAQRFYADGGVQGSEMAVNTTNTTGEQARPDVAMDADGNYAGTWEGTDVNQKGIHQARSAYFNFTAGDGTEDSLMTFTGTVADINLALDGLTFIPQLNFTGTANIQITVDDLGNTGSGGPQNHIDSVDITVGDVNDAPSLSAPGAISVTEDIATALTGISFSDIDAGGASVVATPSGGVTVGGTPTALTLTGSTANINTFIAASNLTYTTVLDDTSTVTLDVLVNDQGNTGSGGAQSSGVTNVTLNVNGVNDAPMNHVPGAQNTATNTAVIFSVGNVNDISVSDIDAGGAIIQMTLSAPDGNLTLNGTAGLTFLSGTVNGDSTIIFTGTIANINTALDGLRFDPTFAFTGSTMINVLTDDLGSSGAGGQLTANDNIIVNVSFTNAAPVLTGANDLSAINEDTVANPGTSVSALIAGHVSDANAGALSGIAVTAVDNSNGTWEYSTNGGTSWMAIGNPSDAAALLLADNGNTFVRFVPNADWNGTVTNGLTLRAWDQTSGAAGGIADITVNGGTAAFSTATASASVTVNAVNDAPGQTTPGAIGVAEDAASALTGISFSDVDAGAANVVATFTVPQGTLAAISGGGVTVGGTPTALTLTGSTADINAFIAASNLTYTTVLNDTSQVTLGVSVNDQGNTGSGGALSSGVNNVTLNVTPVNDAPTGTVNITGTPTEDQVLTASNSLADADGLGAISYHWQRNNVNIAGATANTYTLGDIDVGTTIRVVASYIDGQGTPESVARADVGPIANINDTPVGIPTITGTATEDQILTANTAGISDADGIGAFNYQWLRNNVAIAGATAGTYTLGDADVGTLISVNASYTDGHGTAEGPLTSVQTAAVSGINDAPVISNPPAQTVIEGDVLAFSAVNGNAIAISDVDAGAANVELSLTATDGTLTLANLSGLGFSIGDGIDDATMRFTGSVTAVNNALNGLSFTSSAGFTGNATVSARIDDLGNSGAGHPAARTTGRTANDRARSACSGGNRRTGTGNRRTGGHSARWRCHPAGQPAR